MLPPGGDNTTARRSDSQDPLKNKSWIWIAPGQAKHCRWTRVWCNLTASCSFPANTAGPAFNIFESNKGNPRKLALRTFKRLLDAMKFAVLVYPRNRYGREPEMAAPDIAANPASALGSLAFRLTPFASTPGRMERGL
jgi:hypothetical protein